MTKSTAFGDRELYGSTEIIIAIDKGKHKIHMHEHERIWHNIYIYSVIGYTIYIYDACECIDDV